MLWAVCGGRPDSDRRQAAFTRILGMTTEEADAICTAAARGMRSKTVHSYNYLCEDPVLSVGHFANVPTQLCRLWAETARFHV